MLDILLIEDNPADVLLFEEYIDHSDLAGSRITVAMDLKEAIGKVQEHPFDVVVLDLSLPDGRGKDTFRGAQKVFAGFPVIILSGTDDLNFAKASVQGGIQDYLVKGSLDGSMLARSINYAIERNKLMNEKATMERHLIERNHYLEIVNRRLEQFAYTVSHNLRAPLARILGLTQVIRYETLDGEASTIVELIEQASQDLDDSVRGLTDLLIVQNQASRGVGTIDMEQLFASIVQSLSHQIREARATISSDFTEVPAVVYSEPVLQSVLLNLLTNAIRYRSDQRPLSIKVSLRPTGYPWCCLSVSDNGLGMDLPEVGQHLFTLFARFHKHAEGQGIGLHMIKSLIEEGGGHIEVESTLNVGTTFKVYFRSRSPTCRKSVSPSTYPSCVSFPVATTRLMAQPNYPDNT